MRMGETKNLMGLNLNVDSELIAEAVKESIIAGIAASMDNKEMIIHEFVKASLTERVLVEDGSKPRGYSSEKTCSRMEWNVRKALSDIVREELVNMVEEQKPALRELIRKEFQKKQVQSQFVEMFMLSMTKSITNKYSAHISCEFTKESDY